MESENKLALVTGGSSGIGKELTWRLARMSFDVIFTSRSKERAEKAAAELGDHLKNEPKSGSIEWMVLDLDSIKAIHKFVKEFLGRHKKLNILVNNAGGMNNEFRLNEDGIESTFASNHLGPLMLTLGLLPLLEQSSRDMASRIIFLASSAHWMAPKSVQFTDEFINSPKNFSRLRTYNMVKLCNILTTKSLNERIKDRSVIVNCCHPGVVWTSFLDKQNIAIRCAVWPFSVSVEKGVVAPLYICVSDDVVKNNYRGEYFTRFQTISSTCETGVAKPSSVSSMSKDPKIQEELWNYSTAKIRAKLSEYGVEKELNYFKGTESSKLAAQ
jgi:retinol dehydrogenase-12